MLYGSVVGEVWSSVKVASLTGHTLLVVRPDGVVGPDVIAVDLVGAGTGDRVVVALGKAARNAVGAGDDVAIEAAVTAIVDGDSLSDAELVEGASVPSTRGGPKQGGDGRKRKSSGDKKRGASKKKAKKKSGGKKAASKQALPDDETAELFPDLDDIWRD